MDEEVRSDRFVTSPVIRFIVHVRRCQAPAWQRTRSHETFQAELGNEGRGNEGKRGRGDERFLLLVAKLRLATRPMRWTCM